MRFYSKALARRLGYGIASVLVVITLGWLWQLERPRATIPNSTLDCVTNDASSVIVFFYKPTANQQQLATIPGLTHGRLADQYGAQHGSSLLVPASDQSHDLQLLRKLPFITAANASTSTSCMDLD